MSKSSSIPLSYLLWWFPCDELLYKLSALDIALRISLTSLVIKRLFQKLVCSSSNMEIVSSYTSIVIVDCKQLLLHCSIVSALGRNRLTFCPLKIVFHRKLISMLIVVTWFSSIVYIHGQLTVCHSH